MTQTAKHQHYLMINSYRSRTSHGFGNTWILYRCQDAAERRQILRDGLPVKDVRYSDGTHMYSLNGIRPATPAERQQHYRDRENGRDFLTTIRPNGAETFCGQRECYGVWDQPNGKPWPKEMNIVDPLFYDSASH